MIVTSREYKFMVHAARFGDVEHALEDLGDDLRQAAKSLDIGLHAHFDPSDPKERTIVFFDTPDGTLRLNGYVFRQRAKVANWKTEYTLKCRSPDRYIAAGANVDAADGLDGKVKLEEDIGVPFVGRFSHSGTVTLKAADALAFGEKPRTLEDAASLFPALSELERDGQECPPETKLKAVNSLQVLERVFTGPVLLFADPDQMEPLPADLALILWTKGNHDRVWAAELSYRYRAEDESYAAEVAGSAKRLFEFLQRTDWADTQSLTKTQLIYQG